MLLTTDKLLDETRSSAPSGERSHRGCPRCDSHSIAHSRIRGLIGQAALRLLRVRPYRCLDCWHRFVGVSRQT